jgi:nicotinate phosphoribosyltransferase
MMRREYASFAEFGTRRRRSYAIQDKVIQAFQTYGGFNGTSNVHFAMKYNLKPIGTMAHEWIMGVSALEGLRHANFHALQNWVRVYNADLGIALTDTFGTPAFFKNFNMRLAKLYDGVRHDSGDPFEFADKVIEHYKSLGIDPMSKVIVFSDGLNVEKCLEIAKYCNGKIRFSFGIGTHFTNDFEGSPALNMVIKIWMCDGVHVVKLGDGTGKTMGDPDAVRVAQWTFLDTPLDAVR